jgi:hypothetical protein
MNTRTLFLLAFLAAVSFGAIVTSFIDENGTPIDHHVGSYMIKDKQGVLYRVNYDVQMLGGNLIINLDENRRLVRVTCDISNIEMIVEFVNNKEAENFFKVINAQSQTRFVTGSKWNCNDTQDGALMLMRRVLGASLNGRFVTLKTAQGFYEESIKDGHVTLDRVELPEEHSKTFCLGVNSNDQCDAAKGPIPIYGNKYISLQCGNCFIGAKATVFVDVQITLFHLKRIAGGLKDIAVNGAFVLDLNAQGDWSAGYDKLYKIVDQQTIIQFWIGPIPITIWYEIPLQLIANAKIDAQVQASVGAKANWKIGDFYIEYNDKEGWKVVKPQPVFNWEPVLKATGYFNANADLSIIPSFVLHVMRMLQAGVKITPQLFAEAHGDIEKKEICADLKYKVVSDAFAEVHINIPIVKVRYDKYFGPYVLYNTGEKPIGHWCVKKE